LGKSGSVKVGALTGRLASRYSATGQTNRRIEAAAYPATHSTGISKIPQLHKDVPPLQF
jgi:hypothetical protein